MATICAPACTPQNAVVLLSPADAAADVTLASETQPEVQPSIELDVQPGVELDVQVDIPPSIQLDTQVDIRPDALPEVRPDTRPDTRPDARPDAPPDTRSNAPRDAPLEAPRDAPPATPLDGSLDAQLDAQPDAPTNVLFRDDFAGGYEFHWLLSVSDDGPVSNGLDGNDRIAVLDATADEYSRLRCNVEGDIFRNTDIIASMKFRIDKAPISTRTVRLDVRQAAETENIFYAVGATIADDGSITRVGIFKKVDNGAGNYTICSLAQGKFATPVMMGQWRTIKLAISGVSRVHLVAYFEDAQVATYDDDCVSDLEATDGAMVANGGCLSRQTGLGIQVEKGIRASVDDVLVMRL